MKLLAYIKDTTLVRQNNMSILESSDRSDVLRDCSINH